MKIIKVENCRNCPLKKLIKSKAEYTCGAVFFLYNIQDYLENGSIPEWCPLEEYEEREIVDQYENVGR